MKCNIDVIIRTKMSWRVNKKRSDIVLIRVEIDNVRCRCEKLLSPASNVKHVCKKRLRASSLPKRCIWKSFVVLIY